MCDLSIVLLTWNSAKHIKDCFDSLLLSIAQLDYEILVVDNGSTDQSVSILKEYESSRVKLLLNPINLGVAKSRNQALRQVNGKYVLILDIDTVVNKAAIDAMIACLDNESKIGLCGCKLKSITGEEQLSCRKFPSVRYKIYNVFEAKGITVKYNKSQFYLDKMKGDSPFDVDYVIGACQLVRKSALDEVGLLDEKIFYGPEDADFCLRMKQQGWRVLYLPNVSIVHHYQQISNKNLWSKHSFVHAKALLYYFLKHRSF